MARQVMVPLLPLLLLLLYFPLNGTGLSMSSRVRRPPRTPSPELPITWSNPQGEVLTQLRDDFWVAERPFYPRLPGLTSTDVGGKMAVIRLPSSGGLWVCSPVELTRELKAALAELGPVEHIVTPNTEHQKYAPDWIRAYPEAESYACPGLREKKPEVGWKKTIGADPKTGKWSGEAPAAWEGAIDVCWMDAERGPLMGDKQFFSEVVFCHRPSRSLFVTDLWWNYPSDSMANAAMLGLGATRAEDGGSVPTSTRLWKFGMDQVYKPFYNSFMAGDPSVFNARLDTVLSFDWDLLVPCHGEPIAGPTAKPTLERHLGRR